MSSQPRSTAAIHLRPLRVEDAHEMTEVLSEPALYAFTGGRPPAEHDLERRFALKAPGRSPTGAEIWLNYIVCLDADGSAVGFVQATIPADTTAAEVAWVIGTPWQGRGIATAAMKQLIDVLRDRGTTDLIADIHPDHQASQRIAESLGMARTGEVVDGEERWAGTMPPQM